MLSTMEDKKKQTILEEAAAIVSGPRREAYGHPAENHGRTAQLWATYLGCTVTARDVCMLNVLQKVGRDKHKPGRDNLVDIAGYAENAQLCERPVSSVPLVGGQATPNCVVCGASGAAEITLRHRDGRWLCAACRPPLDRAKVYFDYSEQRWVNSALCHAALAKDCHPTCGDGYCRLPPVLRRRPRPAY